MTPPENAAAVTVNKIGHMVPAVVRNGVILCPECGDEMVEVGRDGDWINYECRTGKSLWDFIYRDLKAAFNRREEEGHDD